MPKEVATWENRLSLGHRATSSKQGRGGIVRCERNTILSWGGGFRWVARENRMVGARDLPQNALPFLALKIPLPPSNYPSDFDFDQTKGTVGGNRILAAKTRRPNAHLPVRAAPTFPLSNSKPRSKKGR